MAEYKLQDHQTRVSKKIGGGQSVLAHHSLGSGKTLTSLDSARAALEKSKDGRALFVVPAPLRNNLAKEMDKHGIDPEIRKRIDVDSYEGAANHKEKYLKQGYDFMVMDEAHRLRNAGLRSNAVREISRSAKQRLLLTGTPVYNHRSDIAKVINTTAGGDVMPEDARKFDEAFIAKKVVKPGLLMKILGVTPGEKLSVKNKALLRRIGKDYMDRFDAMKVLKEDFPDRTDEMVHVDMSTDQLRAYQYAEGTIPLPLRLKIRMNLPLDKKEAQNLNAFSSGIRQISNTNAGFTTNKPSSPKIDRIVSDFEGMMRDNPNHKGIIYSNYLGSGLEEAHRQLKEKGVPTVLFTGETTEAERKQAIHDYNSGKVKAILLSSAGSEGLDLKGTRSFQGMEPHFNNEKINQVIGRGIRYKSHAHLPEEERKVRVMRYASTKPKFLGHFSRGQGIDDYLKNSADTKDSLTKELLDAMTNDG